MLAQQPGPFQVAGRMDRTVAHAGWLAARDRVMAGLATPPFLVAVLGAPGLGKTLLLHEVSVVLRGGGIANRVVQPGDAAIIAGKASVLLIDDASRLEDETLRRLAARGRPLALAGRPMLLARLQALGVKVTAVELSPLPQEEIGWFLAAGARPAGRREDLFRPDAVARLAAGSQGVPRLIHGLARTSLLIADQEQARQVEVRHVERAIVTLRPDWAIRPASIGGAPVLGGTVLGGTDLGGSAVAEPANDTGEMTPPPQASLGSRGLAYLVFAAAACLIAGLAIGVFDPPAGGGRSPAHAPLPMMPAVAPVVETPTPQTDPVAAKPLLIPSPTAAPAVRPPPQLADAPPPLPAMAVAHVIIRFPGGDARAAQRAADLASWLREDGFLVADPVAELASREAPGIRYVFAEDRGIADRIVAAAQRRESGLLPITPGLATAGSAPLPRPGTVDILLASSGGP